MHLLLNRRLVNPEKVLDNCIDTCLFPASKNGNEASRQTQVRSQAPKSEAHFVKTGFKETLLERKVNTGNRKPDKSQGF